MTSPSKLSGLSRPTYETSDARLDNFPALESDWRELLPHLVEASAGIRYRDDDGQEGTLVSLWEDQVLTVLVDVVRQAASPDTESLQSKAAEWIVRLDRYINKNWRSGNDETTAVQVARQLKELLTKSLPEKNNSEKQVNYHILRTLRTIQELYDFYLAQIENSGNMDAALSLLLAYLRNYGGIARTFNHRFATLPELYFRDILHAVPRAATPDSTYIVVTPMEDIPGFTLPAQQSFPAGQNTAGEELFYQTMRSEYITPMQCVEANAVYISRKEGKENTTAIRKQAISKQGLSTRETLFSDKHSRTLPLGWMVESSMFVLGEGKRNVCVSFRISSDIAHIPSSGILSPDCFILQFSEAKGWAKQPSSYRIDTMDGYHRLCFDFTISSDGILPAPCTEEIHGMVTEYPALRILTGETASPYEWASLLKFDAVKIQTDVTGIRNFTFYNELGQVDTSQPFQPFGIQAEKGAWFLFGNEEMGLKPLEEVRLKGLWKKLPETEAEFNQLYKSYAAAAGQTIDTSSFTIATEWQQGGKWKPCQNGVQHLFVSDHSDATDSKEDRSLIDAEVVFDFMRKTAVRNRLLMPYEYSRDRDGFFRATLLAPSIGFGTDTYRTLFTETMIYNSHSKEKKRKELPPEPPVPQLADVELSYIASEETLLADMPHSSIRLSRITALSEQETVSVDHISELPFLPAFEADNLLYFAFLHAKGEQTVQMYLDMILPKEKIPFNSPQPGKSIQLTWEFWSGNDWRPITIDSIYAEETMGLTQSGFVEIRLPEKVKDCHTDKEGRVWLRAAVKGDVSACLAVRNIWTNCIRLTAQNDDGSPLPAATIESTIEPDERIESIVQPLPGFGSRTAETDNEVAVHQSSRISNRHRAINIKDYERLVMEHFSEVDKVQCLSLPQAEEASTVCLVVFSSREDSRYFLSPAWKLTEIQRVIRQYTPPFVSLRVINPVYEKVNISCKAVLWDRVQDEGKAVRQLVVLAQNYVAPWYRKKEIPALRQSFSYNELHARMANHEDLMKLVTLKVVVENVPNQEINEDKPGFKGLHPWSVLFPEIKIELLSPHDGINEAEIGGNFIIR